jgi:hypothetical protein
MWSGLPSCLHTGVKYCYVATNFITDIMMRWMRRGPYEVSGNWQHGYLSGMSFHFGANNRQNNAHSTHSRAALALSFPFLGVCLENRQICAESAFKKRVRDAGQWACSRSLEFASRTFRHAQKVPSEEAFEMRANGHAVGPWSLPREPSDMRRKRLQKKRSSCEPMGMQ